MSNPVSVKWFTSTMSGAPVLSGEVGKLIPVLDACLVNGFGSVTLSSLVVAGGVATATQSTAHNFLDHAVILIAGATPSGLNGEKRIVRVSNTVFTFDATGISDQTATGTITAKMAPVGWEKRYSGTNKAAYARTVITATAMLLRVDDSDARFPTLIMYETMSDVDTGTNAATTLYTAKSSSGSLTLDRPWRLVADDRAVYLFIDANLAGTSWTGFFFGDIQSFKVSDAYACALVAHSSAAEAYFYLYALGTNTGARLCRSYTGAVGSVAFVRYAYCPGTTNKLGDAGMAYPNPADGALHARVVEVWESTTLCRGVMPGLLNPLHPTSALTDGTLFVETSVWAGHTLRYQKIADATTACLIDLTGPWIR